MLNAPSISRAFQVLAGLALAAALAMPAGAQAPGGGVPVKGKNYLDVTPPQPVDTDAGKVEVIEFFWYGCPHCYALEPLIGPWEKKLPKDAVLKRVPAVFNDQWGLAAKVYYTLDALGQETRVRAALFDAVHKQGLKITEEADVTAWAAKNGIEAAKFKAAYNSFSVQSRLARAQQMTRNFKITGVPTFAVQGKYMAGSELNGDGQGLLDVTGYLVNLAVKAPDQAAAAKKATR